MKTLLLAFLLASCYGHVSRGLPDPSHGRACVFNREWSQAIVEVRIREALIDRLRLETMQRGCVAVDRLPEQVYFQVRLLAGSGRYNSEPVLLAGGQELWLEIEHRPSPSPPMLWVTVR